jgi:hypothetical protein
MNYHYLRISLFFFISLMAFFLFAQQKLEEAELPLRLRSVPIDSLSFDDVKKMLQDKDYFDFYQNTAGKGFDNRYQPLHNGQVIYDQRPD